MAALLGVNAATLRYWERGRTTEPGVTHVPKILAFLGYDPRPEPQDLPGRCRWRREAMGLTQKDLALQLGLDPSSICRFESRKLGGRKVRELVERFVRDGEEPGLCRQEATESSSAETSR